MPIYEYKCDNCGIVEVMQRITENPLKKCPNCKGKVERIISHTSFVLKGSGWYATDYANKSKSDNSKSDSGSASSSGASSDSSANGSASETKAETKSSGETSKSGDKSKGATEKSATKPAD